ncbi:unnamed protein product [Prunus brigantina]
MLDRKAWSRRPNDSGNVFCLPKVIVPARRMNLYLRMRGRAKESESESVRLGARLKRGTAIASPEKLFEFVNSGLWMEVGQMRTRLREKGLEKPPGVSWIVVKSQVHCFVAGDTSHLQIQSDIIYASLNSLSNLIKESGYIPDIRLVLRTAKGWEPFNDH